MKRLSLSLFTALALAACSNGGTSNDGGTDSGIPDAGPVDAGPLDITLSTVGVHPAAVAALAALNRTPPSLASGYAVVLQAVTVGGTGAKLTAVGEVPLDSTNDTGPITFSNLSFAGGIAALGVISAIVPTADGGAAAAGGWPTCADLYSGADGGFVDYFVTAGAQVQFGPPTASITNGVAFAIPASYVALLDCAAGLTPGNTGADGGAGDLLTQGFALAYASQDAAAGGAPLAGITFSGNSSASQLYYPAGYAAGTATASPPTSANGIATVTGNPTPSAFGAAGGPGGFTSRDLATAAGSVYQVFYAPGT
ncbi:MAG: hypothetical protein ACYDCL_06860 [Myxococcales bacterium]